MDDVTNPRFYVQYACFLSCILDATIVKSLFLFIILRLSPWRQWWPVRPLLTVSCYHRIVTLDRGLSQRWGWGWGITRPKCCHRGRWASDRARANRLYRNFNHENSNIWPIIPFQPYTKSKCVAWIIRFELSLFNSHVVAVIYSVHAGRDWGRVYCVR